MPNDTQRDLVILYLTNAIGEVLRENLQGAAAEIGFANSALARLKRKREEDHRRRMRAPVVAAPAQYPTPEIAS